MNTKLLLLSIVFAPSAFAITAIDATGFKIACTFRNGTILNGDITSAAVLTPAYLQSDIENDRYTKDDFADLKSIAPTLTSDKKLRTYSFEMGSENWQHYYYLTLPAGNVTAATVKASLHYEYDDEYSNHHKWTSAGTCKVQQ